MPNEQDIHSSFSEPIILHHRVFTGIYNTTNELYQFNSSDDDSIYLHKTTSLYHTCIGAMGGMVFITM